MKTRHRYIFLSVLLLGLITLSAGAQEAERPLESTLNAGDSWQLPLKKGEHNYEASFLDGDLFLSLKVEYLDDQDAIISEGEHTLVRDKRMKLQHLFHTDKVVEGASVTAIRFTCVSGKVRIDMQAPEIATP